MASEGFYRRLYSWSRGNGAALLPALGASGFFGSSRLLLPKSPCCCSVSLGVVRDLQEKEGHSAGLEPETFSVRSLTYEVLTDPSPLGNSACSSQKHSFASIVFPVVFGSVLSLLLPHSALVAGRPKDRTVYPIAAFAEQAALAMGLYR